MLDARRPSFLTTTKEPFPNHATLILYRALFCHWLHHVRHTYTSTHARAHAAGGEPECFLAANPRQDALALETLVATYTASLAEFDNSSGNANVDSSTAASGVGASPDVTGSPQFNRRQQEQSASGPLPILQSASDDFSADRQQRQQQEGEKPVMSEHHATEVFKVSTRRKGQVLHAGCAVGVGVEGTRLVQFELAGLRDDRDSLDYLFVVEMRRLLKLII